MTEYNANGSFVTPNAGRLMIRDATRANVEPGSFVMTHAQKEAVENLLVNVRIIQTAELPKDFKLPPEHPFTFCGVPVKINDELPPDVIEFRDKDGNLVGKLFNLACPKTGM